MGSISSVCNTQWEVVCRVFLSGASVRINVTHVNFDLSRDWSGDWSRDTDNRNQVNLETGVRPCFVNLNTKCLSRCWWSFVWFNLIAFVLLTAESFLTIIGVKCNFLVISPWFQYSREFPFFSSPVSEVFGSFSWTKSRLNNWKSYSYDHVISQHLLRFTKTQKIANC